MLALLETNKMETSCTLLNSYWGRSQVFRVIQFSSAMTSGLMERRHPVCAAKLLKISAAVSDMRVMLRLLDDLPVFAYTLASWNQCQNSTFLDKCAELFNSVCSQLYYPVEHAAWAADQQLVGVASTHLWTIAIVLYGLPLVITLMRKLKQLIHFYRNTQHVSLSKLGSQERSQHQLLMLDVIQNFCELVIAVFWMPPGFLWGGKLSATWWGLFGTVASLIGLYKTIVSQ